MKYWNDFITREDLETEPGVVDMEKVQILSLNTYLQYIEDFIDLGGNEFPNIAWEQVENFMVHDFLWHTHALEGRSPEPYEITEYLNKPEYIETRQYWTYICVHANRENWPAFVKRIREEWNIPEEITIRNNTWGRSFCVDNNPLKSAKAGRETFRRPPPVGREG